MLPLKNSINLGFSYKNPRVKETMKTSVIFTLQYLVNFALTAHSFHLATGSSTFSQNLYRFRLRLKSIHYIKYAPHASERPRESHSVSHSNSLNNHSCLSLHRGIGNRIKDGLHRYFHRCKHAKLKI